METMTFNQFESAVEIAKRFDLDPKHYRRLLREACPWHVLGNAWIEPVGTERHADMIAVAVQLSKLKESR
jgi:hypothetical protein